MIKILNSSNQTLAFLENVTSPIISEELNREYTFNFTTVIDNDKSNYVNYQNKVEVEDNYFNIVYTEEERTTDGIFINTTCEHVSYDLLSANFTAGFTATGQFSATATTVLSGTGFTVGTVEITTSQTISVNESTNARQLMMDLAALYGGELKWDKYQVSLLTRRGADRGVQFRYRKNLVDAKRITDNRTKVSGLPMISYEISVAELEYEQGFIAAGVSSFEYYELGDTVRVFDEDLNLDVSLRIVKESHDVNQRMQGTVSIGNWVDDLADTLTQIQTTSVSKDNVYNGCSIGPDLGFVATRSDNKARAIMNATDGIKIQKGDTATGTWTDAIYLDVSGNGTFSGFVLASQIIGSSILGGSIAIGTGSNTFNANGTDGLWLGSTAFATAPFRVSLAGLAEATGLTVISGSITGSYIQSAVSGARTVIHDDQIDFYDSGGNLSMTIPKMTGANLEKRIIFYQEGTERGSISNTQASNDLAIEGPAGSSVLIQMTESGALNFAGASTSGLSTDIEPDHTHTVMIGTASYTTSLSGQHSHNVDTIS
ncbi:MAG: phage tail protein [Candidatus Thermoplasmatota archaeon]|nr:phage tail protein [Candidatus Thermoplasmatota archaeon]